LRWPVESSRAKWWRFSMRSTKSMISSVFQQGHVGKRFQFLEGAADAEAGDAVGR
jgi:hypothetical protein